VLPDPHGQIIALKRELAERNQRIAQLEQELVEARTRNAGIERGAEELRAALQPLYRGLLMVFGHIEEIGVSGPGVTGPAPTDATRQVWESWKQKLGGLTAKAIDVLLLHGPMNQTQLRIQLACASRSVTNLVGALNKAGLINKADGKISLKELSR
jgi:hypothetical protein